VVLGHALYSYLLILIGTATLVAGCAASRRRIAGRRVIIARRDRAVDRQPALSQPRIR
jgi:hypothetical protein